MNHLSEIELGPFTYRDEQNATLIKKAGFTRKSAQAGAVTLIQRFGSALNLNVHFHMLFLDGVYTTMPWGKSLFHRTNAPNQQELTELLRTVSHRVAGSLERQGLLERDAENSYLNLEGDEDPMQQVLGCSVSYRIAVGPQQGRKVFTLQTLPSWEEDDRFTQVAKESGFSLHAGVVGQDWERQKLERPCRYISRPAVSEKRLSLTPNGNIRYRLKTPFNDGTTHVIFEPLEFTLDVNCAHIGLIERLIEQLNARAIAVHQPLVCRTMRTRLPSPLREFNPARGDRIGYRFCLPRQTVETAVPDPAHALLMHTNKKQQFRNGILNIKNSVKATTRLSANHL